MSKQESFKFLDKAKWLISLSFFVVAVVGNSYYTEVAFLYRVLGVVGLIGPVSYTHLTLPTKA